MGLFDLFKAGLKKTAQVLNTDIRDLFKQEGRLLDDAFLRELYALLVKTDMGAGPAAAIRDEVQRDFRGRVVHRADLLTSIKKKIRELKSEFMELARLDENSDRVYQLNLNLFPLSKPGN